MKPDLTPKRADDPRANGVDGWKFRVGLAVKKYPVQVALLCAMVPVTFLGLFLLGAYQKIDNAQGTITAQQQSISSQQHEIQVNRRALSFSSCLNNNAQTKGLNKLNDTLQALIAGGPKQYQQLRPVLEKAGIDVDALAAAAKRNADESTSELEKAKVDLLDCVKQAAQIEKLNPPTDKPVPHSIPPQKK